LNTASLRDVIEKHRARVMGVPGVVAIAAGISRSDPARRCVHVYVTLTTAEWPDGLPHQLDGYDIELVKTPGFRAT
jgi:hypothetical protein